MAFMGKREGAITNLNAVVATGAGSWVDTGNAYDVLCTLSATAVTTGGTVKLEGNTVRDGTGITSTIATVGVSATGVTTVAMDAASVPAALRWNVSARTDGTYAAVIQRRT